MPAAAVLVAIALATASPARPPLDSSGEPQIIAHRGAMNRAPENSGAALDAAIEDGAGWVEVDVRLSKDGHHVLYHDALLDRASTGSGPLKDRTLAELQALDIGLPFAPRFGGTRILSLKDGLDRARGRLRLYLDLKEVAPASLAREILDSGMEDQVILYDTPARLAEIRRSHPGGTRLALMAKWRPGTDLARLVAENHLAAVEIDAGDITPDIVRQFHALKVKVQAKTLGKDDDRPEVWDRLQALGVDWIQTDHAEEIAARFRRKRATAGRGAKVRMALHRGASLYAPENTISSLNKAFSLGADLIEFDIQTTRDGHHVVLHDGRLDRTTSVRGRVRDHDLKEVARLDAGTWFGKPFRGETVPTLDAFLDAFPAGPELYVDAKDIAPDALAAVLRRKGLEKRSIVYQSADYLERLRAIAPEIRRMPPLRRPEDLDALADRLQPHAFDVRWAILSRALIDRCHARGILVFSDALGPNETAASYRAAIKAGIDVIQTDHPLPVLDAIAAPR